MEMTPKLKKRIDGMSYEQLLREWRFAPIGSKLFQGESGEYWRQRMTEMKSQPGGDVEHTRASKRIGW